MRKIIIIFLVFLLFMLNQVNAQQIYSLQLQGFDGIGSVYYQNGFYQGYLSNGIAHGVGTYYFRDGTIFQGWFNNGWRNGPGVVIIPYQGYLPSCWNMGSFIGEQCPDLQTGQNSYSTNVQVRKVISETYSDFPNSKVDFVARNPNDYQITQISSSTQLGKTLLGKYSGH